MKTAFRFIVTLVVILLVLAVAALAVLAFTDVRITTNSDDRKVQQELQQAQDNLDKKTQELKNLEIKVQ